MMRKSLTAIAIKYIRTDTVASITLDRGPDWDRRKRHHNVAAKRFV